MTITCKVNGEFAQNITCQLDAGQTMFADATKFRWKTANVTMETRLTTPGGQADQAHQAAKSGGGSFLKAALATATEVGKRMLSGQSLAFQWFTPSSGSGLVTFSGDLPGQVSDRRARRLDYGLARREPRLHLRRVERQLRHRLLGSGTGIPRQGRLYLRALHGHGHGRARRGREPGRAEPQADYGGKIHVHGGRVVAFS